MTDAVPTNTTFVSASITTGTGWSITQQPAVGGTGNIVFSNADVPNQGAATFEVVVKVNANAPIGATITNNATAAGFPVDPTPGNNTDTATARSDISQPWKSQGPIRQTRLVGAKSLHDQLKNKGQTRDK